MIGFIVNPASGNGNGRKVWETIERTLGAGQRPYIVRHTGQPGDAIRFAREMARLRECEAIVAVGGDGTLNEVAAGLLEAGAEVPLAHLPAGSGNDFARALGIPFDASEALAATLSGSPQRLDAFVLRCGTGPGNPEDPEEPGVCVGDVPGDVRLQGNGIAVCSAGAGFDGKVAQVTNRAAYKKWLNRVKLGSLAYFLSVLRVLATYKPCRVRLTVDGQTFEYDGVWLVAVTNIPYFGGGMRICPQADPRDGLADVCVVHRIGRLEFLRVFPLVYSGRHITHPGVRFHRGRRICIHAETRLAIHADGEYAGETPLEIRVCEHALPVIRPSTEP